MNLCRLFTAIVLVSFSGSTVSQNNQTLTVTAWGGVYEQAQVDAYFKPFEIASGIKVRLHPYAGGIPDLRKNDDNNNPIYDVADLTESDARFACENNLLVEVDYTFLKPAPDGTSVEDDLLSDALLDCGIGHLEYATVVAYDERAFLDEKPTSISDFFDIEKFPGKRALQKAPLAVLEWAMLSYDIPPQQIYELLSTERGLNLVTRRLNQIRDHIVWWESGTLPPQMLQNGKVVMASGYLSTFFEAAVNQNAPIAVIPDGQLLEFSVWGILQGSPNQVIAKEFVQYVTAPQQMAALANIIPYSPTRNSALNRIGLHKKTNVSMRTYMPMRSSSDTQKVVRIASDWYSRTENIRERWFNEWLESGSQN